MRKLVSAAAVAAVAALAVLPAGASAAHCQSPDGTSPGFSYFGTTHVKQADHAEGGNPGPHAGTSGASNCRETTGSPSERAPGQNRVGLAVAGDVERDGARVPAGGGQEVAPVARGARGVGELAGGPPSPSQYPAVDRA